MVRSHAWTSSAVGGRPTPYVGNWAAAGQTPAATRSITMPMACRSLDVDIVHAPVGRHLPALDGVVVINRVQAAHLDQGGQRRLDVAGLVGAPRLEDGLAPVPWPVEPEARVGEAEDRFLEVR